MSDHCLATIGYPLGPSGMGEVFDDPCHQHCGISRILKIAGFLISDKPQSSARIDCDNRLSHVKDVELRGFQCILDTAHE